MPALADSCGHGEDSYLGESLGPAPTTSLNGLRSGAPSSHEEEAMGETSGAR